MQAYSNIYARNMQIYYSFCKGPESLELELIKMESYFSWIKVSTNITLRMIGIL